MAVQATAYIAALDTSKTWILRGGIFHRYQLFSELIKHVYVLWCL